MSGKDNRNLPPIYLELNNRCAQTRNSPILLPTDMNRKLVCKPMDADWRSRMAQSSWWSTVYKGQPPQVDPRLYVLRNGILAFGGEEVCLPAIEDDLLRILARGQFWYGDKAKLMKGSPSQCHANSCNLWSANRNNPDAKLHIATGYALSDDGMWRQHSWLVYERPRVNLIVETTVKRVAYYGFVMTEQEALAFYHENW